MRFGVFRLSAPAGKEKKVGLWKARLFGLSVGVAEHAGSLVGLTPTLCCALVPPLVRLPSRSLCALSELSKRAQPRPALPFIDRAAQQVALCTLMSLYCTSTPSIQRKAQALLRGVPTVDAVRPHGLMRVLR